MNWNNEKEEKRWIWYLSGFPDGIIGALSVPFVGQASVWLWRKERGLPKNEKMDFRTEAKIKAQAEREKILIGLYDDGLNDSEIAKIMGLTKPTIRAWRIKRGLSPNAVQGWQSVQRGVHRTQSNPRKKETKEEPKDKPKERDTKKRPELSKRKLAEEAERTIVESLPTKDEVLQKVRNSPLGQVTTAQLIKQGYGDVGSKRRDTIGKLRELVDKDKLLELDTSKKGQIIWRAIYEEQKT